MSGHNIEREIEGRRFLVEFRRGYDDWEERYYRTAEVYELSDGGKRLLTLSAVNEDEYATDDGADRLIRRVLAEQAQKDDPERTI